MSLQSKGKSTSGTREDNANAVRSLVEYLRKIIFDPSKYYKDTSLIEQLKTQGGLTTLKTDDFEIPKMALRTLISRADDPRDAVIDGGWDSLKKLRKCALDTLTKKNEKSLAPNKQTKAGLEELLKIEHEENRQLWDEIAHLTFMFQEVMSLAQEFADKCVDPSDQAKFLKRKREVLAMFAPQARLKK